MWTARESDLKTIVPAANIFRVFVGNPQLSILHGALGQFLGQNTYTPRRNLWVPVAHAHAALRIDSRMRTFLLLGVIVMRQPLEQLQAVQLAVVIIVMHQEELNLAFGFLKQNETKKEK